MHTRSNPKLHMTVGDDESSMLYLYLLDVAPTEIYSLSLHDALPIFGAAHAAARSAAGPSRSLRTSQIRPDTYFRSEEHTSELQSRLHLVFRLLLEKKKPE